MALDLIVQEAAGMSDEALTEVLHFMRFIKMESAGAGAVSKRAAPHPGKKLRTGGIYQGKIRIADDFDAPLDDFREYMK